MVAMPVPRRAESTSDSTGPSTVGCMPSPSVTPPRGGHDTPVRARPHAPANRGECPEVSPLRFGDAAHRVPRLAARDLGVIRDQLLAALQAALDAAGFPEPEGGVELTPPTQAGHGDFTTNVAMQLTKPVGLPPRDIAAKIVEAVEAERAARHLERVEVAGPGFLNLYLAPTWLHEVLRRGRRAGRALRARPGPSTVSASTSSSCPPTPPARSTPAVGAGSRSATPRQPAGRPGRRRAPRVLPERRRQPARHVRGVAVRARYEGEEPPEDGYQGEYLVEMADADAGRARRRRVTEEQAREWGYRDVVRDSAGRPRPHRRALRHLVLRAHAARARRRRRGAATTSATRGVVVRARRRRPGCAPPTSATSATACSVKSDGSTTYLCNDLAYHRDKFARGWEHLIDIWGADHHGQVKSLQAGHGGARLPGGRARGAARSAGEADAAAASRSASRSAPATSSPSPTSSTRSIPTSRGSRSCCRASTPPQTFDLDVVTAQSMENPVYYVQYAHARIASIGRQAAERGRHAPAGRSTSTRAARRTSASSSCCGRSRRIPSVVAEAAELRAPHRVTTWVRDFAKQFHGFYRDCRVHLRRRRAHPGPPLAGGGVPPRSGRARSRSSACTRPTRWHASTTTTPDDE